MTSDALTSGITTDDLDPAVRPQDDLFRHVNGRWIARTEIPDDKARYGSFLVLAEEAEAAVRDIIHESQEAEPGTEARKVGDLFTSFLDEGRVEALGAAPLRPLLEQVEQVGDVPDLLRLVGSFEKQGVASFVQLFVDNDPGDPERYVVFLEQGGLGLPDESYYREEKFESVRTAYVAFVETMLGLAGLDDAAGRAARVVALETELATHHWSNVATRDSDATYNLQPWSELAASAPGVDLAVWRDAVQAPAGTFDEVVVREPSFVSGLAGLLVDERLPEWRDWLSWQVVRSFAAYLSSDFVEANFDFYGRTLTGTPVQRARWKRGVSFVEGAMGEAVGRIYVERHFAPAAKTAMDDLVANLVEAYRQSITQLSWMTDETRQRALDKLDKFTPKIGYPVKWRDYSALEVDASDLIGNVRSQAVVGFDRELAKIGSPIDRDEWFMTPQTINAYYNPGFNEIVFPAAILQFPFFEASRDAAANYGAIGAVIGHEIGHGFDDQGSQYDGDGNLENWWTVQDRAAFEVKTKALIEQYDGFELRDLPGEKVNGSLTVGENIGDLGGLTIAYKAFLIARPEASDEEKRSLFLNWSYVWRGKRRPEQLQQLLAVDPHSPAEFRANIVRNLNEFHELFETTESDALWLDPEARVGIW